MTAVSAEIVMESTLRIAWNTLKHEARIERRYEAVPKVSAVASRLGQVLLNLLVNAAQAMPERPAEANTITVGIASAPEGRVEITIQDNGAGIPEWLRSRIFAPFVTTKPAGVGTGLGLPICQQIVTSFGGSLTFESELGVGTCFTVSLPAVVEEAFEAHRASTPARTPTEAAPESAVERPRARLLIVDDEALVARAALRSLDDLYDIVLAKGGEDARELLERDAAFDLVLCDLMMPGTNGMDLYETLRARQPELAARFVAMTGGAFTERARAFLEDVPERPRIQKPFDRQGLRAEVEKLLERVPPRTDDQASTS